MLLIIRIQPSSRKQTFELKWYVKVGALSRRFLIRVVVKMSGSFGVVLMLKSGQAAHALIRGARPGPANRVGL